MQTLTMKIDGMRCAGYTERIWTFLEKDVGAWNAAISFEYASACVVFNKHSISQHRIDGPSLSSYRCRTPRMEYEGRVREE